MSKATDLIERSIAQNEIAHAPYDAELARILESAADDSVENGDVTEYWGVDDDGSEWRVHLDR